MKKVISVAVRMNRDLGSVLVGLNFLQSIQMLPGNADIKFELFMEAPGPTVQSVLAEMFDTAVAGTEEEFAALDRKDYAIIVDLDILPILIWGDWHLLRQVPELLRLGKMWEKNAQDKFYTAFYRRNRAWSYPYLLRILSQQGKTFLNAPDIDGTLGIRDKYTIKLSCDPNINTCIARNRQYISVHTGQSAKFSTVQWAPKQFEQVIAILRSEYPQYAIVQLGLPGEKDKPLKGVDLCLTDGKDWEKIKYILENAAVHIDYDSGLVHLRKALHGGPSVVLFGPTSPEFYGYGDDLAVRGSACDVWCMQLTDQWNTVCQKSRGTASCMASITPQMVMQSVQKAFSMQITEIAATKCSDEVFLSAYRSPEPKEIEAFVKQKGIFDNEAIVLPASELYVCAFDGQKAVRMPLAESPMIRYLQGNTTAYKKEIRIRGSQKGVFRYTREEFDELIKQLKRDGMQPDGCRVVATANNVIEGGEHQAAIWMHLFGPDVPIRVTRVYKYETVISEPEKAAKAKEHRGNNAL